MKRKRQVLDAQIARSKAALEARERLLQDRGGDPATFAKDPKWRQLRAFVRAGSQRLVGCAKIEKLREAVANKQSKPPA